MKKTFLCLFLCFLVVRPALSDVKELELQDDLETEVEQNERIKIKEIKQYLETINPDTTCMDELVKRRKQLIVKLSLSPVVIAAGGMASFYVGGAVGAGAAHVLGATQGWTGLGYVVGGAVLGTAAGAVALTADTAIGISHLVGNNLILKALAEYHMDRPGQKMQKLHQKVTRKLKTPLSEEEFQEWLVNLDETGKLCDGSLVKQPRLRIGPKLKYKVSKVSDLKRALRDQ